MATYHITIKRLDTGEIVRYTSTKQFPAAIRRLWTMVYDILKGHGKLDTEAAWKQFRSVHNFSKFTVSKGDHISNTGYAWNFKRIL